MYPTTYDWAALKHPSGKKILAVYKADQTRRVLISLEGDLWDLYGWEDYDYISQREMDKQPYTRSEFDRFGWGNRMKAEPIWKAGQTKQAEQVQVVRAEQVEQKPSYYPFKSEQHKKAYYGYKE